MMYGVGMECSMSTTPTLRRKCDSADLGYACSTTLSGQQQTEFDFWPFIPVTVTHLDFDGVGEASELGFHCYVTDKVILKAF